MERVRLLAPLVLLLLARRGEAQQPRATPMKIAVVEMDTVRMPHTHAIAALVRTRLEHYTTREELRVVPRKVVTDICDSGCPERWDGRWLREVANPRVHGETGEIPAQMLVQERLALQPLPPPYRGEVVAARAQPDTTSPLTDKRFAGVPPQHELTLYDRLLQEAA